MRILRVLRSSVLPCGCFVGLYETYDGRTVQIVEEVGPGCLLHDHCLGETLDVDVAPPAGRESVTSSSSAPAR